MRVLGTYNRRASLLTLGVVAVAAVVVGASVAWSAGLVARAEPSESSRVDRVDFDKAFANPRRLASVQEAQGAVAFKPVAPAAIGRPLSVFVNADETDRAQQALALIFQHPKFGRFMLVELPNAGTPADLAAVVANCTPATPCVSEWSLVRLSNGAEAVLKVGSPAADPFETTGVLWMRGNVAFQLLGPATSFSPETALTIANIVEATP